MESSSKIRKKNTAKEKIVPFNSLFLLLYTVKSKKKKK